MIKLKNKPCFREILQTEDSQPSVLQGKEEAFSDKWEKTYQESMIIGTNFDGLLSLPSSTTREMYASLTQEFPMACHQGDVCGGFILVGS